MTLTTAAGFTKKFIFISIITIVIGAAAYVAYSIWYQSYLSHLPPVEEKPDLKFGLLPAINFPATSSAIIKHTYSLDTVTGGFPDLPKLIKVYFIPQTGVTLLAPDKSRQLAQNLGFSSAPQSISNNKYQFADEASGQIIIDLGSGNFNFQKSNASSSAATTTDKDKIIQEFKNYLSSHKLLPEELNSGRANVTFDNNLTEVSFWPKDISDLLIVTANFKHGLIKAAVNQTPDNNLIITKLDYVYWPIDLTTFATYPLKTPGRAFEEIKNGKGYISLEAPQTQVSISSVRLAYFEPETYSPYLMPVYIFEGPQFAALVSAIEETYLQH